VHDGKLKALISVSQECNRIILLLIIFLMVLNEIMGKIRVKKEEE